MIKVKTIIVDNTATPEIENKLDFGSLFNGIEFIYFESDEERIEYLNGLEETN